MTHVNHLFVYCIGFALFFVLLLLSKAREANRLFDDKGIATGRQMLMVLHLSGIILFGILPVCLLDLPLKQIVFGKSTANDLQVIVTSVLVLISVCISPVVAEKKFSMMKSHLSPVRFLNNGFILNYFIVRIIFLCAYEIWFRGIVLRDCSDQFGVPAAIVLTTALYVFLHSVNGKEEMRGCVPLGLLLCILCIWTEAAWPAIVLHISFAISYELHIVKRINNLSISLV